MWSCLKHCFFSWKEERKKILSLLDLSALPQVKIDIGLVYTVTLVNVTGGKESEVMRCLRKPIVMMKTGYWHIS